jgi:uncharacterized protein (TIGR04255 family)
MTVTAHRRPHFRHPPIHEQAISLSFSRIREFGIVDPGLFWAEVMDDFPVAETGPRFVAPVEMFEDRTPLVEWEVVPQIQLPKALFKNGRGEIIQLQDDSFTYNWIRDESGLEYPRYEVTSARLWELYEKFERFIARRYGQMTPLKQCELTNVNIIAVAQFGKNFSDIANGFRVDPFAWDVPGLVAETYVRQRQHRIVDADGNSVGRLHSVISPFVDPEGQQFFRFELTARSAPGIGGADHVREFFALAHNMINGAFLESVTPAMRQTWEEYDG